MRDYGYPPLKVSQGWCGNRSHTRCKEISHPYQDELNLHSVRYVLGKVDSKLPICSPSHLVSSIVLRNIYSQQSDHNKLLVNSVQKLENLTILQQVLLPISIAMLMTATSGNFFYSIVSPNDGV